MRSLHRTSAVLFSGALLTLTACQPPSSTPGPDRPTSSTAAVSTDGRAVVVFPARLSTGPGTGIGVGLIEPNTVVELGGREQGWQQVQVEGPPSIKAWVRQERIGCRALAHIELTPADESKPDVKLRPGALLAIHGALADDRLDVQTQGTISVRGRIPRDKCGVGQEFIPSLPRDGTPHILVRDALLTAGPQGQQHIRLPEGHRFAVFVTKGKLAYGRTDGAVSIRGHIDALALERDKTTPFDRLAEPLGYSHEVLYAAPLTDGPDGSALAQLPGGTPLSILGRESGWARIKTFGAVQLEGWVQWEQLRRVSLDYNDLDPGARRRDHHPTIRNEARGMEVLDEPELPSP